MFYSSGCPLLFLLLVGWVIGFQKLFVEGWVVGWWVGPWKVGGDLVQ